MREPAVTFQSELTRKTLNSLESLARDCEHGKITDSEMYVALEALWEALAGLIDTEVKHILTQLLDKIRPQSRVVRMFMTKKGRLLIVDYAPGTPRVRLRCYSDGTWLKEDIKDFSDDEVSPNLEAKKWYQCLVKKIFADGGQEV